MDYFNHLKLMYLCEIQTQLSKVLGLTLLLGSFHFLQEMFQEHSWVSGCLEGSEFRKDIRKFVEYTRSNFDSSKLQRGHRLAWSHSFWFFGRQFWDYLCLLVTEWVAFSFIIIN